MYFIAFIFKDAQVFVTRSTKTNSDRETNHFVKVGSRMDHGRTPKVALRWNFYLENESLTGQRTPGAEQWKARRKKSNLLGGEAQKIAKGRDEWRRIGEALFPKWEEDD